MRNTYLSLAALVSLAACQSAPKPLSPADETAIRASMDAFVTAANANDVNGMAAGYASDAIVHPSGMPSSTGMDAIKKMWTDMTGMMRLTKFTSTVTKIAGQGDVAYLTGTYHMEATTADSTHTVMPPQDGKFVEVLWRQADGSWKVVADSWNENSMPGAAPAPAPTPRARHLRG